jgi:peptidoglycan/LPS O-acetylase OafA/YrhL
MKKHLPTLPELIEFLMLMVMLVALQWSIGSWGWTIVFALGFVWNWAMLNGWTQEQIKTKKYRFSSLRLIMLFHHTLMHPLKLYPRLKWLASLLPAALFIALIAHIFEAPIPWAAAVLGSLGFMLLRSQLARLFSLPTKEGEQKLQE